jgi:hypothetical protein
MVSNRRSRSPCDPLNKYKTCDVAVRCFRSSLSSRVSRATSVSPVAGNNLARAWTFGALRRFGPAVFRRCPLIGSPPALDRFFIAVAPEPLQVTIPIVTSPPVSSLCVCADSGLQQKVPLGALILGLGGRTAPLPRRLLLGIERRTRKCQQRHCRHPEPRCWSSGFVDDAHSPSFTPLRRARKIVEVPLGPVAAGRRSPRR